MKIYTCGMSGWINFTFTFPFTNNMRKTLIYLRSFWL